MANENKDVIRVQDTEVNLSSLLRAGMIGFASDSDKMAYKRLDNSTMKYWSDDSKQCLLAGTQTITGAKNFSGTIATSSRLDVEKAMVMGGRSDIGAGYVDASTARASATDIINLNRIIVEPSGLSNDYYALTNKVDGQVIFVWNESDTYDAYLDDDETGGIYLTSYAGDFFVWDETLDKWV